VELKKVPQPGYEEVWEARDPSAHFHAFIALHNLRRGPALGGVRFWSYPSRESALADALRLARSMTFKAAIANLPHGGGKGVILKPKDPFDRGLIMDRFAQFIASLEGRYITAKDVGTDFMDMARMHQTTPWVTGLPQDQGGAGGPSPLTAYGVLVGIRACVENVLGSKDLTGIRVAIQGLGGVGAELARLLVREKAEVWGSDLHSKLLTRLSQEIGLRPVLPELILNQKADILAPCAMGQILSQDSISKLKVKIVAGGANDQLSEEIPDARLLKERGILFAPDFVINAGGLIHVAMEFSGYDAGRARQKTQQIGPTLKEIFSIADREGITNWEAALELAASRLTSPPSPAELSPTD